MEQCQPSDMHVECNVTVPMGLIRAICGSRFRKGETEGNTGGRPDDAYVGFRAVLAGPSKVVMPACHALFKGSVTGQVANFAFRYTPQPGEIFVNVAEEDIVDANAFLSEHPHLIMSVKGSKKGT